MLFVRYLIENNNSSYVEFHEELTTNIEIVKSRFRNIIQKITFLTKE